LGLPSRVARFAEFELDSGRYELRREDHVLKLEKIPMDLLTILVESNGQLVTRDQIIERIWGKDVFLDTEHGINTAIRKIRKVLGDDPDSPRFVQTVPGKGYRFIAATTTTTPSFGNGNHGFTTSDACDLPPAEIPGRDSLDETAAHRTARVESGSNPATSAVSARRAEPLPTIFKFALACALASALVVVTYAGWQRMRRISSPNSNHVMLAVLPFENLSGDPNQDYFSDGLTEEIITQLGALNPDQLGVIARTTSMAYKGTSKSVQQIARELGVDYILESSVRRDDDHVRISVQLIRTGDQVHTWARDYDRQLSHSIALQDEVARAVAEQIKIKLSPTSADISRSRPLDPEANEAYLRGRYFGNQFTIDGYRKAIAYFQQAIDRDPNFAEAYSGLADSHYFLVVTDAMSPQDGESKALDAARQAVALDEGRAESHSALGSVMLGLRDWPQAEVEFKRAIELDPSYSTEHRLYAALLTTLKRHEEAREQIRKAMLSDPLSLPNNAEVVRALYYARDYDQAVAAGERALQLNPDYYRTHFWLARVYAQQRRYQQAVAEAEKVLKAMPESNVGLTELAYSLAAGGRAPEARKILRRLEEKSRRNFVPAYNMAVIHVALHENNIALRYLQKAYEERDWALMVLAVEPRLDPLRSSPAFQDLLQRIKLPS
jgi:TolB-like protein/DNA-binding winged helix-turn-helix (wHTH) protein/Tfp pilus assembly protein PilF